MSAQHVRYATASGRRPAEVLHRSRPAAAGTAARWPSLPALLALAVLAFACAVLFAGQGRATEPPAEPKLRTAPKGELLPELSSPMPASGSLSLAAACPPGNEIVQENCLPGSPASEWDIVEDGDRSIQGFATDISVNQGDTVRFKIDTDAAAYRLDIYRMGWYGGLGARYITTVLPSAALPQVQPACLTEADLPPPQNQEEVGLVDCGNWAESASWTVPADATSGIYFAKLVRTDTGGASHILFIVRDDDGGSDILFQTSDTTWHAYNAYGGNSLYVGGTAAGRAYKVSYNRPFMTRASGLGTANGQDFAFYAEYPLVRWLERNGYDVSYFTGVDSDRYGALIQTHKVFLSVGHDEYWSAQQRANVEAARDAGVHLAFFSGNEVFWKTRWEPAIDGTPHRTLVCYKDTHAGQPIDPVAWTGTWRDPRFSPPLDGGRPENALTGQLFTVNDGATTAIQVPSIEGKMRFWRNTSVARLTSGQIATLPARTLGYEWDEDIDNGFRPAGLVRLSKTTVTNAPKLLDYGSTYGSGTAIHRMTLYRAASGALVFGAGTVQWMWGLDDIHDGGATVQDVRMQQATVNLFADMGVQPATRQSDLVAASKSTDVTPPTSTITSPANGATVTSGTTIKISGKATDVGGRVGGVEVSTDGGATWRPATGLGSWSFNWKPATLGPVTLRSRAVDDSGNLETPGAGVTVTVGLPSGAISLWPNTTVPSLITDPDTAAVELGMKFRSSIAGYITGIEFYKGPTNTGPHVASLWRADGTLLARRNFVNETASGWQFVAFSAPVPIEANTVYVASYHTTVGQYSVDTGYFLGSGYDTPPLRALRDGESGGNGVYVYTPTPAFPTETYQGSNYWVDVRYRQTLP